MYNHLSNKKTHWLAEFGSALNVTNKSLLLLILFKTS